MLILLPPSEGKATTEQGPPLDLGSLSSPSLTPTRERVLDAVVRLCQGRPARARQVLGLSARQDAELERNRSLRTSPTVPAAELYTGVLYDALGWQTLGGAARRRATRWVCVSSALWGAVRLSDRIPPYRLSGDVELPRLGKVAPLWRAPLEDAMPDLAGRRGVILDLRSGTYAKAWLPTGDWLARTVVGRVLLESADGSRSVVSHHNKATKGRLVRALAERGDTATSTDELVDVVRAAGFGCDLRPGQPNKPAILDIVVAEV